MAKWLDGIVNWFDELTGEGVIESSKNGKRYYVHYSTINSKSKYKNLRKDQPVRFRLYQNSYLTMVEEVISK